MGEVYRARDQTLERDVAVKVLSPGVVHDPERIARFRREAQLLAPLNRPSIATVYRFEESDDLHCLVMELVPGQTLEERLKAGALPVEEALPIGVAIAEALDAAHRQGITHRDVKPANIKLTLEGRVKVLDFGLAKLLAGGQALSFKRPDGRDCVGYFAQPSQSDDGPGVVVIQEWWGVDDNIKAVAERFAANGYRALVPDLYRGKVTLEAAEAAHLMGALDFKDAATQDVRGAVLHLKQRSPKVAAVGFCMGGAVSILVAIHVPEADAVSYWYGIPPPAAGDPRTIARPLQGHFAQHDPYFPPTMVDTLEAQLKQAGVVHEFHRYDAEHAFANDTGPHYDRAAADLAWQRCFGFLSKHCG